MKKLLLGLGLSLLLVTPAVAQQLAPVPRAAPRTPVNRESAEERRSGPPRDMQGVVTIMDGEKLRMGNYDLRLFGIVPPQLSANFGPQARAALDALIGNGQSIECHIRDRDHDGPLLASCTAANGSDPALELLRRGLAVTARGSLANSELAPAYLAAEQAAQLDKLGLWSVTLAAAGAATPVVVEAPKPVVVEAPKAVSVPKVVAAVAAPVVAAPPVKEAAEDTSGLFARYQILIAGALILITALSILAAIFVNRRMEKRDELKALAAALRGELLAARAVCLTRVKSIVSPEDDRTAAWPRIRSTLYQAYVGKLGWLGAELARQVASIYGQASDYAAYYNTVGETAAVATPKKQALQTLAAHIDEVLPRLAGIEQTGQRLAPFVYQPLPQQPASVTLPEPVAPMMAITSSPAASSAAPVEQPNLETKFRGAVRVLRERFTELMPTAEHHDDTMGEYSLADEDGESFSLGEQDDDEPTSFSKFGN